LSFGMPLRRHSEAHGFGKKEIEMSKKANCAPTPEFMEAFARSRDNGTDPREEMQKLWDSPVESVRYGIDDEQEQHNAVAAKWPHLYGFATDDK